MALQSKVYTKLAAAVPGQVEVGNQAKYSPVAYKVKNSDTVSVTVGHGVFLSADDATSCAPAGSQFLGFVPLLRCYSNPGFGATLAIPNNEYVTPLTQGAIAVVNAGTTAATVGMNVFVSTTDGSVQFASAATLEGHTPTNFVVVRLLGDGAKDSLVIIDNQTAVNYPTAA